MLSHLLFIIVLEALFMEIISEYSKKVLYIDNLILISDTLEGLKNEKAWKGALKSKGLRVNVRKEGKFP